MRRQILYASNVCPLCMRNRGLSGMKSILGQKFSSYLLISTNGLPKEHYGRENQRGSEDKSPIAFHIQKDRRYDVAEDLAQGNVELI